MSGVIPSYLTFQQALTTGHVGRMEDASYRRWVRALPCVACNQPGDDPHHIYDSGFKGMGTKVPDHWCLPICRGCHDELHHDVRAWEDRHGSQWMHVALTLLRGIYEGRLTFD